MKPTLTFLCSLVLLTVFASAEVKQPNVVLIFADDMGYGDVSAYDAKSKIKTPHLDRLAKGGMRFTDAHSASAVCTPSRPTCSPKSGDGKAKTRITICPRRTSSICKSRCLGTSINYGKREVMERVNDIFSQPSHRIDGDSFQQRMVEVLKQKVGA